MHRPATLTSTADNSSRTGSRTGVVGEGQGKQLRRGDVLRRSGRVGPFRRAVGPIILRSLGPVSLLAILGTIGYLAWPTVYADQEQSNLATLDALNVGLGGENPSASAPPSTDTATEGDESAVATASLEGASDLKDTEEPSDAEEPEEQESPTDPIEEDTAESSEIEPDQGNGDHSACFELVLREDFDGPLGSAWQVYDSAGNHSAHAIRIAEAVSVVDGKLVITATNGADGVAASGGVRHVLGQTYGKYSFSVRTDPDVSNATSGVILTWPVSESQPLDGENNMYETLRVPGDRSRFYSFIHKPFDELADGISQNRFVHRGDATKWQEVTMEWAPDYVEVSWTNPETGATRTRRIDESPEDLITDAAHFLAIQLDLFKGAFPDNRAIQMEVDWVEVYSYCG